MIRGHPVDAAEECRGGACTSLVENPCRPESRTGGHTHDAEAIVPRPDDARDVRQSATPTSAVFGTWPSFQGSVQFPPRGAMVRL